MSVIGSNILAGASGQAGYFLTNSLRFRDSASARLTRTPASASNRKTYTFSAWVKLGKNSDSAIQILFCGGDAGTSTSTYLYFYLNQIRFYWSGVTGPEWRTTQVFRDYSSWYHIVAAVDTNQATLDDKLKLYINGVRVTSWVSQNSIGVIDTQINNTVGHALGSNGTAAQYLYDGYMTEFNLIDGLQLTPASFGETSTSTGVWIPKKYTGTYGTNGFYLPFTDNSALTTSSNVGLGKDFSGNGNYFATNGISITSGITYDSMTDVPTLTSATAANYATINPLDYNSTYLTLNDGNLHQTYAGVVAAAASRATMVIPTTGKFYWEVYINATGGGAGERVRVGITSPTNAISGNTIDGSATSYLQLSNGNKQNNASPSTYGAGFSAGQYIQVLYDATAGAIYFGQNGSYANGTGSFNQTFSTATAAFTGLSGEFMPCFITYGGADIYVNFGQQPFTYTPPSGFGFVRLNTFNLLAPPSGIGTTAAELANKYMDVVLYNGNNSTQNIAVGFQPDWVWSKCRNVARSHRLSDAVRGSTRDLYSDTTDDEDNNGSITSFISTGFSLDNATGSTYNTSGETYVSWAWKANGAGSANTAGTIASTVSSNTTAGFSIVTYTGNATGGATVGHGLGVVPSMIILKSRSLSANWYVYHSGLTSVAYQIYLNFALAEDNAVTTAFNSAAPGNTTFTLPGTGFGSNNSGATYVAYCFAQVAGYSAFGKYTGNGSSDGPFVFTGFRPRFVLLKSSSAATDWYIYDTARDTYNVATLELNPNLAAAEQNGTYGSMDILSNGFKLRFATGEVNASGATYIYMAFAENPFKYANAR